MFKILELGLPNPAGAEVDEKTRQILKDERDELAKWRSRNMAAIEGPIHDLTEAFAAFKKQEEKHGVRYLVKPSGSLTSPLAHYLNQPSLSTDEDPWEDSETADL